MADHEDKAGPDVRYKPNVIGGDEGAEMGHGVGRPGVALFEENKGGGFVAGALARGKASRL